MKKIVSFILIAAAAVPSHSAFAQAPLTVSFSDPSRPGLVKVSLINGGIAVRAYPGRDVIIEDRSSDGRTRPLPFGGGTRRIDPNPSALSIEEENNVMTISTRNFNRSGGLDIQVPQRTSLNLKTQNGGNIVVEGVDGEIEVTNTNGAVILNNVAGSVVAHSVNGRVQASLRDMTPNKPMAFTSMNGNVDITLPTAAKATLKMHTDNGTTYTEFEILLRPTAPVIIDSRNRGRLRIQTDRTITGTINGGGPDFDLRTFNGNIYIRKAN